MAGMSAPVCLGDLFPDSDDDDADCHGGNIDSVDRHSDLSSDARDDRENPSDLNHLQVGGETVVIREYAFHSHNANAVWPGTYMFADFFFASLHSIFYTPSIDGGVEEKNILELGSATGVLSLFLRKKGIRNVTTSDIDTSTSPDNRDFVEDNIAYNFALNEEIAPRHWRHTWGTPIPAHLHRSFDLIIASDILLYISAYPALVTSLCWLMKGRPPVSDVTDLVDDGETNENNRNVVLILSWQRRMKGSDDFFDRMKKQGFRVQHLHQRIYRIE